MKIRNLVAGVVRKTVKGVTSTSAREFKSASRSMYRQVLGKPITPAKPESSMPKTYNSFSARGETNKFGLNLMSQVSGKKFTYQELQELQAASGASGNTVQDQLRAKINKFYTVHAQKTEQQKAADQKKAEEVKEQEFREEGQRRATLAPVRRDIAKTRTEIKQNLGAE